MEKRTLYFDVTRNIVNGQSIGQLSFADRPAKPWGEVRIEGREVLVEVYSGFQSVVLPLWELRTVLREAAEELQRMA